MDFKPAELGVFLTEKKINILHFSGVKGLFIIV